MTYSLRILTIADIPEMQALFRSTVLHVNKKDYTQEEVEDWASCGESVAHWQELFGKTYLYRSIRPGRNYDWIFIHEQNRLLTLYVCA